LHGSAPVEAFQNLSIATFEGESFSLPQRLAIQSLTPTSISLKD